LVTHYNLNKISLVDTGLAVSDFLVAGELDGPIGLARDANGILYIGNFNDGRIFRFTAAAGLEVIGDIPGWLGFMTLAGDAIYATGWQDNRIYKVPLDGSGAVVFAGTGALGNDDGHVGTATFSNPNGIVATSTGDTLYVSDYTSRSLRMITGANTSTDVGGTGKIVQGFQLDQNYPNPFNPATTIRFSIPVSNPVTIGVYDLAGKQVALLLNEGMPAGKHEVRFDGRNLSSGIYLVRMVSGIYHQTHKMMLLK
jgi:sugar lactone lactonase YvrE